MRTASLALAVVFLCPLLARAQDPNLATPPPPFDAQAPVIAVPLPTPPPAAATSLPPLPPRAPGEQNAADRPLLSFGTSAYFIKPILAMAGGIQGEHFIESINENKEDRVTTLAITRFGLEGRLGPYISFRSEFEKNIGRHGTGI
jgi:hypothetical protein